MGVEVLFDIVVVFSEGSVFEFLRVPVGVLVDEVRDSVGEDVVGDFFFGDVHGVSFATYM